jgi:L-ascorbate metabolism protein UlaG (beta-lactamase superfamily)
MMSEHKREWFLRQDVQVEPLYNQWYAWVHLIPPATAAFQVVEKHLRNMESYLQAPHLHASAVNNPAFRGGPFLDLLGERVNSVKDLLEDTRRKAHYQLEFCAAVRSLDRMLQEEAQGYSMESLYSKIPTPLQGLVELFYDRHHRPDFRLFEPLLYRTPLYDINSQSIALSIIREDCSRPFIFSTPRLDQPDIVRLKIPFASDIVDALFRAKVEPVDLTSIADLLRGHFLEDRHSVFCGLFTREPPPLYSPYAGQGLRMRYFGHACILIESAYANILIDPILSYTYETPLSRYTYRDLPDRLDYVLITHSHHDHILLETMLQIRHKVGQIIVPKNLPGLLQDPSLKLMLNQLGFLNVLEFQDLQSLDFPGGTLTAVPFIGEHHDLQVLSKLCYHIRLGERTILAVADACNIHPPLYELVHKQVGDVDVLFLGMECDGAPVSWVYGPLFTHKPPREKDHTRRGRGCNAAEGLELVRIFNCKEVYVYAMGAEPWVRYILNMHYTDKSNPIVQSNLLLEECHRVGRIAERLFAEKEIH